MKHLNNFIIEKLKINKDSKSVDNNFINKFINKEITPDNFNENNFTSKESKIIKDLLKNYNKDLCYIYLVNGNKIPDDPNIKQYFGNIVPKNKKGILYIERQSTMMGTEEYVKLYEIK